MATKLWRVKEARGMGNSFVSGSPDIPTYVEGVMPLRPGGWVWMGGLETMGAPFSGLVPDTVAINRDRMAVITNGSNSTTLFSDGSTYTISNLTGYHILPEVGFAIFSSLGPRAVISPDGAIVTPYNGTPPTITPTSSGSGSSLPAGTYQVMAVPVISGKLEAAFINGIIYSSSITITAGQNVDVAISSFADPAYEIFISYNSGLYYYYGKVSANFSFNTLPINKAYQIISPTPYSLGVGGITSDAQVMAQHSNRVFWIGSYNIRGAAPPQSPFGVSILQWSDRGKTYSYLNNNQIMPMRLTGLLSTPNGLMAFGEDSIYLVNGDFISNISLQKYPTVCGCDIGKTPIIIGGVVYTIWRNKLYALDGGGNAREVSMPLLTYGPWPQYAGSNVPAYNQYAIHSITGVGDGKLLAHIVPLGGVSLAQAVAVYDSATDSWAVLNTTSRPLPSGFTVSTKQKAAFYDGSGAVFYDYNLAAWKRYRPSNFDITGTGGTNIARLAFHTNMDAPGVVKQLKSIKLSATGFSTLQASIKVDGGTTTTYDFAQTATGEYRCNPAVALGIDFVITIIATRTATSLPQGTVDDPTTPSIEVPIDFEYRDVRRVR